MFQLRDRLEDLMTISKVAIPVMLGMILQSLLSTVNMYFLAKLGNVHLSASILGAQATGVIFILASLTTAGVIAVVAQNFGAQRYEENRKRIADAFVLSTVFGILVTLMFIGITRQIVVGMFNPSLETTNLADPYVWIMLLATPAVFGAAALRSALQGLGKTMETLLVFGSANVLNMILVPLFIFVFGWGIEGAAWATVIANIFSLMVIYKVVSDQVYDGQLLGLLYFGKESIRHYIVLLRIGSWSCLQQIARPITGMLMFRVVYEVGGDAATAAFGIGGQLLSYTFIVIAGLTTGISVLVGQCIGAGTTDKLKRIISTGIGVAAINMLIFAIPYVIFGDKVIAFFAQDAEVISVGTSYLKILYVGMIAVVWTSVYSGVFQGAGDTFPPMIGSTIANVVIKVPLAYLLVRVFNFGTDAVWWAVSLSIIIEALIIWYYYKRGQWLKKKAIS